jgi:hypothetical protein
MFYWLAEYFGFESGLNLFRYLSFRSGAAVATALFIGMLIGPKFISMLRVRQGKGQPIRRPAKSPSQGWHADHGRPDDVDFYFYFDADVDGFEESICLGLSAGDGRFWHCRFHG